MFCVQFDATMVHNMLAFMFHPKYWGLKCVTNLIGKDKTWIVVNKYDTKKLIPFLVVVQVP